MQRRASTSFSFHAMQRSPEEVKARFATIFGRAAPTYDRVIPFFDTFARHLVETARLKTGERVLDVACGSGTSIRYAAQAVGPDGYVLGLDLSEAMIAEAEKNLSASQLRNAHVEKGDAEHLDLPAASFDVVLCGFGVFFFPDPAAALSECRRVLRAGGRFAASTFLDGLAGYKWEDDVLKEIGLQSPPQRSSPVRTAKGLVAALALAGFDAPVTTQVEERFVFSDVDAFLAWNWSHGGRGVLEAMSQEQLARFRSASAARLANHAIPGGYEYKQAVELTVAVRP